MISIKDVARAAGVSNKTVSRVVNNEPNVSAETLERVKAAIDRLNYVPNLGARSIRTNQSQIFGIITDFVSTTPYSGEIVRGIQTWARGNGKTVLLANTEGDAEEERAAWRTFQEHRISGVLYVTMYHRLVELSVDDLPIPTVLVNCRSPKDRSIPSVTPDDYHGSRTLTRYLLDQGHRRLAYIRLNPRLHGAEERFRAFNDEIAEAGNQLEQVDVRVGMSGHIGKEDNFVFEQAMELFAKPHRPTAVLCGNDEMALKVHLAALTSGLKVPDDVSIVGFDDFRTVSLGLEPHLTTSALPYFQLGFAGAERLDKILRNEPFAERDASIPCPLIERGSCATPARP